MPVSKVYDHTNFRELLAHKSVVLPDRTVVGAHVVGGYDRLLAATPRQVGRLCGARWRDVMPVFDRATFAERIADQKNHFRTIEDYQKFKPHDQDGLPTCWANGPAHAFTTMRVIQGLPLVYMSANSAAVPISGGHSGGNEADAGDYSVKYGWSDQSSWANNDTDRSLNSAPAVVESRKHHTAPLILDLQGWDEFATAALMCIPFACAFNWWSHVISGGRLLTPTTMTYRNNWNGWGDKNAYGFDGYVTMAEGHGTPDSGFAYVQVLASAA